MIGLPSTVTVLLPLAVSSDPATFTGNGNNRGADGRIADIGPGGHPAATHYEPLSAH